MNGLIIATIVLQIVLSLILIVVVLFQHGSQTGLSGSIAGGAETFFGKNKGRTIDAQLKKWTSAVAILFLVSSIALSLLLQNQQQATPPATTGTPGVTDVQPNTGDVTIPPVEPSAVPAE